MSAPRFLFQAHNRRGLGHLMRAMNIATELKVLEPEAEILIYSKSPTASTLCKGRFQTFIESDEAGMSQWPEAATAFRPDVIIYDTVLPKDTDMPPVFPSARQVYIMRKSKPARQEAIFQHALLDHVSQIIIPHTPEEFSYRLPPDLEQKCTFVGPIVRRPTPETESALRKKYQVGSDDFLLTSTVGGGGFQERADHFFDVVFSAHEQLVPKLPNLRHLVIEGPNYQRRLTPRDGMTILKSEPEMVSLLSISDLVIAEGGYNTVSEIRLVKTPAVFLPSIRNYDDQEERVRLLEEKGLAYVFTGDAPNVIGKAVSETITSKDALREMREKYANDQMPLGNRNAAEKILGEAGR